MCCIVSHLIAKLSQHNFTWLLMIWFATTSTTFIKTVYFLSTAMLIFWWSSTTKNLNTISFTSVLVVLVHHVFGCCFMLTHTLLSKCRCASQVVYHQTDRPDPFWRNWQNVSLCIFSPPLSSLLNQALFCLIVTTCLLVGHQSFCLVSSFEPAVKRKKAVTVKPANFSCPPPFFSKPST